MGKKDSSKTRVAPIFDELQARDSEGVSWLQRLLSIPTQPGKVATPASVKGSLEVARWADDEQALAPPQSLLRWLVENPSSLAPPKNFGTTSKSTHAKREALLAGDVATRDEALHLIESKPQQTKGWHIFEGLTYPDVYLQTEDVIIVIEGKRTEAGPTTSTQWMPSRHQMLRHLDCAWERRGPRQVYGFFVVEGAQDVIPEVWKDACSATIATNNLEASLPHRAPDERQAIAQAFVRVTSWQEICRVFEIAFGELPDEA